MTEKLRDARGRYRNTKKICKECYSYKYATTNYKGESCGNCRMHGHVTYGHLTCSDWIPKNPSRGSLKIRDLIHRGYNYKFKTQRIEPKGRT